MVSSEPDPRKHCHGSRDELEAHQITLVETPGTRDKPEITLVEVPESKDQLEALQTALVETPASRDELQAPQITQVNIPSTYLVPVSLNSSDYPHSTSTDK